MIIGLTGKAGSGKSTAAQYLVENHGFTRLRFTGPLKAMVKTLCVEMGQDLDVIDEMIRGTLKEHPLREFNQHSPRHAMQTLGTEWGRKCMGEDFWVNVARQRIISEGDFNDEFELKQSRLVFDDVRFENEAAMIREMGGTVIHITGRGGIEGSHESEAGVGEHESDYPAYNGVEVDYLYGQLRDLMTFITSE